MNIVITGAKGSGKSTVGAALAEILELPVIETDSVIEELHETETGDALSFREIYETGGEEGFRKLEHRAAKLCAAKDWHVIITGGGTFMDADSRRALRAESMSLYLSADDDTLWERATANGTPSWLEGPDGKQKFLDQTALRDEVMRPFAS